MNIPNVMTIQPGADSILVNELSLQSGIIYKNRHLLRNVKYWHKFVVSNTEGLSRDEVLKTILDHIHPLDLIPVFFAQDNINAKSFFMARNCEAAVEKLCKDNLVINHPYNNKSTSSYKPFKLSIILNFSNTNNIKIDVQKNVLCVLQKRLILPSRILDLTRFYEDPELTEFCPLSQPKIMYFVLHISKTLNPVEIILCDNGIKLLNPLDVLIGLKLKSLDLSRNEIPSLNDLSTLKHFHLKELKLTGNPLCACEEHQYVSSVRVLCPTVEILDGVSLSIGKFPFTKRNFLCDDSSFDLVNQFLEYFFTVYDFKDRKAVAGLYHNNAMFSLTTVYLANQLSSQSAFLKTYSSYSRNLKRSADMSKTSQMLFRTKDQIMELYISKLPLTEHDPFSFTVDVVYKTDKCAVIVVTGVFREIPTSLLDKERLLGFARTFALEINENESKCVIVNEQLHVYNILTFQQTSSFLETKELNRVVQREILPKPQGKNDNADLVCTLEHISNLKEEWAKKCLEECQYDLKKALELFVELYKADKIPRSAFLEIRPKVSEIIPKPICSKVISPPLGKACTTYFKVLKHDLQETNFYAKVAEDLEELNNFKQEIPNPSTEYVLVSQKSNLEVYEKHHSISNINTLKKVISGISNKTRPKTLTVLR